MNISELRQSFDEITVRFAADQTKAKRLALEYLNKCKDHSEIEKCERLSIQCYSHITTSMEDAAFWMKRLVDGLEDLNGLPPNRV